MMVEYIYTGKNNAIDLQLTDDSDQPKTMSNSDLTNATKVSITVAGQTFNSEDNPNEVSFTVGGMVTLKLGRLGLPLGKHVGILTVFDGGNPQGVEWQPGVEFRIV